MFDDEFMLFRGRKTSAPPEPAQKEVARVCWVCKGSEEVRKLHPCANNRCAHLIHRVCGLSGASGPLIDHPEPATSSSTPATAGTRDDGSYCSLECIPQQQLAEPKQTSADHFDDGKVVFHKTLNAHWDDPPPGQKPYEWEHRSKPGIGWLSSYEYERQQRERRRLEREERKQLEDGKGKGKEKRRVGHSSHKQLEEGKGKDKPSSDGGAGGLAA